MALLTRKLCINHDALLAWGRCRLKSHFGAVDRKSTVKHPIIAKDRRCRAGAAKGAASQILFARGNWNTADTPFPRRKDEGSAPGLIYIVPIRYLKCRYDAIDSQSICARVTLCAPVLLTQVAFCGPNKKPSMLFARIQQWCVSKTPCITNPPQRRRGHRLVPTRTKRCVSLKRRIYVSCCNSRRPVALLQHSWA